jgi:flavorubredoxin
MPGVINYVERPGKVPLKNKVGTTFRSYGWSGEGPIALTNKLKGYGMKNTFPSILFKKNG